MRVRDIRTAERSTGLQPRCGPCSQAGKASTAGSATGRAPRPPPCAPHPLPGPRTQPAAAVRSRRSRLGEAGPTLHPGPRASDFFAGLGEAVRASPSRLQSRAGLAGRPGKSGGSWPRPGSAPARRGADPGAAVRSRSVPGAPESGRLLRLQLRGLHRPSPKLPAPLGHFAPLRTLGASLPTR